MGKLKSVLLEIEEMYLAGHSVFGIAAITCQSVDFVQQTINDLHSHHDQETYAAHSYEEEWHE